VLKKAQFVLIVRSTCEPNRGCNLPFMSPSTLRWLGIAGPVLFWTMITAIQVYLGRGAPTLLSVLAELLLVAVGGALFSNWVANRFDRHDLEMAQRTQQLEALRAAALALTTEVDLHQVLQKVTDLTRSLGRARYAALGVLDDSGTMIEQFYISGMTEEQRAAMGSPPHGSGLLGAIMTERRPIRVDDIAGDPRSEGFPANHPPMRTMLGVPVMSKGRIFGNLYLTDKQGESEQGPLPFTEQDQQTLQMFAAHAAVAIENAQLYQQNRQIAIMQERERFGMNLHDGVIQSIYALGLLLDDAQHRVEKEPQVAIERIDQAIHGLNDAIRDIRGYILDLRPQRFDGRTLGQALREMVDYSRANSALTIDLLVDPAAANATLPQQTTELLHVTQEALANIRKHAGADAVRIHVARIGNRLYLTIEDNGCGFDVFQVARKTNGNGLRNMQNRTQTLNGEFEIESTGGKGTRIVLSVPVPNKPRSAAVTA
jgi:signal transduction histidine kinase